MATMAEAQGFKRLFVPGGDAAEAALIEGVTVFPINSLAELVYHLSGRETIPPHVNDFAFDEEDTGRFLIDFRDIKGQEHVKRALEIACAGSHNMLMKGPPGAGRTLLARALPSILPRLTISEALEITRIYSVAGELSNEGPLIRSRPFRAPHHTISHAGLVGGGRWPRPGEVSMAHRGVLFLDELPSWLQEFGNPTPTPGRQSSDHQPCRGFAHLPGQFYHSSLPMNPCQCGYFGDDRKECTCGLGMVQRYQSRISGPLMDRIDIHADVVRVPFEKLASLDGGETSAVIRARVKRRARYSRPALPRWASPTSWSTGTWGRQRCRPSATLTKRARI